MKQYLQGIWLYLHFHWLWTREVSNMHPDTAGRKGYIQYRNGWGPWKFLLPYLTTYLLSTLLGLGIRPFSGYAYCRGWRITRLIDKFLGEGHCAESARAPILWGSRSAR